MTGGIEWGADLNADFYVGDVVLVEHDVVSLLVEPLRSVAAEEAPHLVQHRPPRLRELRPRRRGHYHRCWRRLDGLHGHIDGHAAGAYAVAVTGARAVRRSLSRSSPGDVATPTPGKRPSWSQAEVRAPPSTR